MKGAHPFFVIGTVGMIITSVMHMLFSLVISGSFSHQSFYVIYPVFCAFLISGTALMVKKQREINPQ